MAKRKKLTKTEKNKIKNRKILKKYGFINQDLRKKPTSQQKSAITRQWAKFGNFLQGEFAIKKMNKTQAKKYKDNGHMVTKSGFAFVDKAGFSRVYFGKDKVTLSKKGKKEIKLFTTPDKFLPDMEKKILEYENVRGASVMYQIGNSRTYTSTAASYKDFQQYLKNTFSAQLTKQQKEFALTLSPKKRKAYKKNLLSNNEYVRTNISVILIDRKPTAKKKGKNKNANKKQKSGRI